MGCKSSKAGSWRQTSSIRSTASSSSYSNTWDGLYQSPFDQESQNYVPPQQSYSQQYYAPTQDYGSQSYGVGAEDFNHRRRLDRRYSRIADNFNSLEQEDVISGNSISFQPKLNRVFVMLANYASGYSLLRDLQYNKGLTNALVIQLTPATLSPSLGFFSPQQSQMLLVLYKVYHIGLLHYSRATIALRLHQSSITVVFSDEILIDVL